MGRAQAVKDYMTGVAVGVLHQPLPENASSEFQDGWGDGRRVGREMLSDYLEARGFASLRDVTIDQLMAEE